MYYYRSRARRSRLRSFLTWIFVVALACVAIWQFNRFYHAFMTDAGQMVRPATAPATQRATTETQPKRRVITATFRADITGAPPMQLPPLLSPQERAAKIDKLFAAAKAGFDAGRLVEGRDALNLSLAILGEADPADKIRTQLAAMNVPVFLGTELLPGDTYVRTVPIAEGDNFPKLAQRYRVPSAFLQSINPGMDPRRLQIKTNLKVVFGPFHARLVKHANRLDLLARDMYVCSFAANIEPAYMVPVGDYRIKSGGKLQLGGAGGKTWLGFEGIDSDTNATHFGWIYGSGGARSRGTDRAPVGVMLADADLATLYNTLVEGDSLLHVEP